ncbi:cytochrome c oxidase subunit II [Ketogulonicigenium vulgare]|uniref:Cytochrome c oxidase subunit 2 n=1 Tax=Ketogulonicigenium vulgare (strain WSH-001) TaxID=759362 RepID=F9Y9G4_KETVW|nr:cytochrome c oxidase subunit II [Ketogulonicigenium vulgare]ADO41921.1 cytochrome c oxidase, subunit II [Ketogulonicigenium vulgare Y25]AEM40146.1 cytochrome c oxidase subunit 2 [Ketogulonicigenium vulgare WSH-001]ALJ80351.1 cytochrome C oxidase subunit II [Ketogulonicigenium vulgare]ANW33186.1 cytochrome c oxidase subunit II [Ketogulonicigenium vulgare]AOZ53845.1 cytochrome C oxidase, subunit II [Ketogulonicigenium vulgare]
MNITKTFGKLWLGGITAVAGMVSGAAAFAQNMYDEVLPADLPVIGRPVPNGINFQPAATELARDIHFLDNMLLVIIFAISIFVLALLAIIIFRFNEKRNPKASQFTHNTPLEIVWTIVPVVILVFIGAFSLPVLFKQQEFPEGDIVINVEGRSWYWNYTYPNDGIMLDGYMLDQSDLEYYGYTEDDYLLATDTAMVIPSGRKILLQVTGGDVIHSWTIPAFGVKQDAVPGRVGLIWFEVDPGMEGIYFGQCSELCGKDHAYMPITVKVVTPEVYEEWLVAAADEYPAY